MKAVLMAVIDIKCCYRTILILINCPEDKMSYVVMIFRGISHLQVRTKQYLLNFCYYDNNDKISVRFD